MVAKKCRARSKKRRKSGAKVDKRSLKCWQKVTMLALIDIGPKSDQCMEDVGDIGPHHKLAPGWCPRADIGLAFLQTLAQHWSDLFSAVFIHSKFMWYAPSMHISPQTYPDSNSTLGQCHQWSPMLATACQHWPNVCVI